MKRLSLAVLLSLPLLAQTPSETVTVDYVEIPVNVVDRAGNPVRGLTRANFEVFDNRARVNVSSFETIDLTSPASVKAAAGQPASRRAFLLLFDLAFSSPKAMERSQRAAREFIEKSVQRSDLVGVATVDVRFGYKILANFTTDRATALAAIADPRKFRSSDPLQITMDAARPKVEIEEIISAHAEERGGPAGSGVAAYELERLAANMAHISDADYARSQIRRQIDWLSQLAASLRNVRGRKQIVFLSEGFDPEFVQGRSARDRNEENEAADIIMHGAWYTGTAVLDNDRRFGTTANLTTLQAMKQAFTGSDVVLNAIDVKGLRVQADNVRGDAQGSNAGLYLLARPTGGEVFDNENSVGDSFSRMLRQQEYVYVLGFPNTVKSPGRLHDLKVKVVGIPAAARVTYRQGYFEGGTHYTPLERTLNAADVITRDIPQTGVHVAAMAVPFAGSVASVVEIDGTDLLKAAKDDGIAAEVFIYAFDEQGSVRGRTYQRLALDPMLTGDKLRANGVKYVASLSLPPGKYAIKTLVRAGGDDRMGFARNDVEVPAPGTVALLQPFVLDDPQAWLLVRGDDRESALPYPFHVNGEPFIPSVTGRVPTATSRKIAVFVTNAQPEELTWETTPPASLLAAVKSADAAKFVLQLDPAAVAARFGMTVRKAGAVLTASSPLR